MVLRSTLSSPIIRILFAIVSGGQPLYLVCYKSVKMIDVFQLRIIKNGLKLKKKTVVAKNSKTFILYK